jgi:hypothetical protein
MSGGLCLVLRAASRTVEELIQEEIYVRWLDLVLGASRTVEKLIEQDIMYVDYRW